MTARHLLVLLALSAAFAWILGCPDPYTQDDDDDQVEDDDDDDTGDDDTGDDDTGDDDTGDDDTGDDDTGDDDTGDDDTGDDDTGDDDTVDPNPLVDQAYLVDLVNGGFVITEPAGVGALLQNYLPEDQGIIFSALDIDDGAGTIDLLIGAATQINPTTWEQQVAPTIFEVGDWTNPGFEVGPTTLTLDLGGTPAWMGDAVFGGWYAPGGQTVNDTYLEAELDTVGLDLALGQNAGFICSLLVVMGIQCQNCPPNAPNPGANCITVVAEQGTCPLIPGLTMQEYP